MIATLLNPVLYDDGKDNPNYPANIEVHDGLNGSMFVFVGDLKKAGVNQFKGMTDSNHMKMAVYPQDLATVIE